MADLLTLNKDIPQITIDSAEQSNSPTTLSPVHYTEQDAVAGAVLDDIQDLSGEDFDQDSPGEDLGARLSTKIRRSPIGLDGKTGYLPDVYYKTWVSKEAIERVMGTKNPEVVDFILSNAKKAFTAVLITIRNADSRREIVKSFYEHGFSDQHLPVRESDLKSLKDCLGQPNSNCGVSCNGDENGSCNAMHGAWLNTFHHKHWSWVEMNHLASIQWSLLVRDFHHHFVIELEDERILPFKDLKFSGSPSGYFSRVSEARMLAGYQSVIKQDLGATIPVALKQLVHILVPGYDIYEEWKRECEAYRLMNHRQHNHIVRGICGFQQKIQEQKQYYLVLEWANGDNLRELWKELPGPHLDRSFIKKIFEQLKGLVDAIRNMHIQGGGEHNRARSILPNYNTKLAVRERGERSLARRFDPISGGLLPITALPPSCKSAVDQVPDSPTLPRAVRNDTKRQSFLTSNSSHTINTPDDVANWRHGDIKPDNILRFIDSSSNGQSTTRIGTLKLADLGRAKANYYATMFRQNESENEMFATMYYEPPDLHLKNTNGRPKRISRLFDIWSIGCVAWETMLWLVYGLSSVNKFVKESVEGNTIRGYSKSTPYWAKKSNENRAQISPVLEEWFDLFLGFEGEQPNAIRDLVDVLKRKAFVIELHEDSLRYNSGYRTNADDLLHELDLIIRRGDENDSYWYPGFDYCAPERLARSRVRPTPALESSRNNGLWKSDSRLGVATVPPSQATAIAMGDEYTHPFIDIWIYELDDEDQDHCAIKHLCTLDLSYEEKKKNVCEHCERFTEFGEELTISRRSLDNNVIVLECPLCEMIDDALEDSLQDEYTFVRSVAGIQWKDRERPLVRICQTPTDTDRRFRKGYRKGLPSLPEHGRPDYFDVLKKIVDHCGTSHNCRHGAAHGRASELPTRLLDLAGRLPRIVETQDLSDQEKLHVDYTALSHRWGKELFLCSTQENIQSHKQRIKLKALPKTFLHAIEVTKNLGLRFLWIDSLCILQGPDGDFDAEAERMQSTFGQAYCVLAACDAQGAKAGFLRVERNHSCVRLGDSNLWASTVIDDFERDVLQSPLNQRGWVLQERALARRTLFFTKDQTYFECGEGIRSESMGKMENSLTAFLGDSNFPKYAESRSSSKGGQADLLAYTFELYSRLDFTYAHDRPVAIDGLIQRMSISYRDENVAGMFGRFWGRCLLWERARNQKQLDRIPFKEAPPGRVAKEPPSWSWMAYDGAIKFLKIEGHSLEWNEEVKRPLSRKRFNEATQTSWLGKQRRGESVALLAPACVLHTADVASTDVYLRYDEGDAPQTLATQCIIIGTTKTPAHGEVRKHHVLLIRPQEDVHDEFDYERIGVGVVPESCVLPMGKDITIN